MGVFFRGRECIMYLGRGFSVCIFGKEVWSIVVDCGIGKYIKVEEEILSSERNIYKIFRDLWECII